MYANTNPCELSEIGNFFNFHSSLILILWKYVVLHIFNTLQLTLDNILSSWLILTVQSQVINLHSSICSSAQIYPTKHSTSVQRSKIRYTFITCLHVLFWCRFVLQHTVEKVKENVAETIQIPSDSQPLIHLWQDKFYKIKLNNLITVRIKSSIQILIRWVIWILVIWIYSRRCQQ